MLGVLVGWEMSLPGFAKGGRVGLFKGVTFSWWRALLTLARALSGLFCASRLY